MSEKIRANRVWLAGHCVMHEVNQVSENADNKSNEGLVLLYCGNVYQPRITIQGKRKVKILWTARTLPHPYQPAYEILGR